MDHDRKIPELPAKAATVTVNRSMTYLAVLTVTVAVFFASLHPRPLFLPTVSGLLMVSAAATALIAMLRLQQPLAGHFTYWDVSAVLLFVALGAGMLVDPAVVEAYLTSIGAIEAAPTSGDGAASGDQIIVQMGADFGRILADAVDEA